eukprot:11374189-Alexandrium_andersonii.AAC.1
MSASLVGSEMCIRDRCLRLQVFSDVQLSRLRVFRHQGLSMPVGCTHEAVSYTHLTLPTICSV